MDRGRQAEARRAAGWVAAAVVAAGLLAGCQGVAATTTAGATHPSATHPSATHPSATQPSAGTVAPATSRPGGPSALAQVAGLVVQGRGAKTGYTREQFGAAWADVDRNGCDTRNDILARDLTATTFRAGTRDCVVLSGQLAEPYTGREVSFRKESAADVQIDHVVALSDAWQKGAAQWSPQTRLQFANDPLNLLAADGAANLAKGDSDTASWLPPNTAYRCRYVARQVAVKQRYGLTVTSAERDAMVRVLTTCPGEPAPAAPTGTQTTAAPSSAPAASPSLPAAPSSSPATADAQPAGVDPDYGTCTNAKAHGAGPYRRGQAEYGYYRDADADGIVCER